MKTLTCKTRWTSALVTSLLLVGLASGTAIAGEPTDPGDLLPDYPPRYPQDPEPDDPYPDNPPLHPQDPLDPSLDGEVILMALPFLMSVLAR